jgi:hypothetical protein
MLFVNCSQFCWARANVDSTGTAVIADPRVEGILVNNRAVVDVMHLVHIHAIHAAVVIEVPAIPIATLVSKAHIAKAIIDAAVVADVWSPVAAIKRIVTMSAVVAPIAGGP